MFSFLNTTVNDSRLKASGKRATQVLFCTSHMLLQSVCTKDVNRGRTMEYGRPLYFCPVISIFFFSSPNHSDQRLDVYHTSTHVVALVRI